MCVDLWDRFCITARVDCLQSRCCCQLMIGFLFVFQVDLLVNFLDRQVAGCLTISC